MKMTQTKTKIDKNQKRRILMSFYKWLDKDFYVNILNRNIDDCVYPMVKMIGRYINKNKK